MCSRGTSLGLALSTGALRRSNTRAWRCLGRRQSGLSPVDAALCAGIELHDYGANRGSGLLISSGCGIMMGTMDIVPGFRWCCDIDRGGHPLDLAILVQREVSLIGLVGWFSLTSPESFRQILGAQLACAVVAYGGSLDLGCATLQAFLDRAHQLLVSRPQL